MKMRRVGTPHFRVGARRAAFLDRDGVLNRAYWREGVSHPPRSLDELEILPGVEAAARRLSDLGLTLIVVTNQPDVYSVRHAKPRDGRIDQQSFARTPFSG